MKIIVILCGVGQAGKSKTLKEFFNVSHIKRLGYMQSLERTINGKKVYAVSLNSPQELRKFCDVEGVKDSIQKRIKKCEDASKGQDYVLIIPFGIYGAVRGELNEDCILKPIEWLRGRGFRVFLIYLRKKTARALSLVDSFMKGLTSNVIESTKEYDRQARELENLVGSIQLKM